MEKDFCKNNCYWNKKIIMLSVYFQVAVNFHLFLLGRYFNKCLHSIYFVILIQYSLLNPCPTEGPIKLLFVCLPVCLSVWCSSQEWVISFFWFFLAQWLIIEIFKNWQFFWNFWKLLSLVFPGNRRKWKLILLLIF